MPSDDSDDDAWLHDLGDLDQSIEGRSASRRCPLAAGEDVDEADSAVTAGPFKGDLTGLEQLHHRRSAHPNARIRSPPRSPIHQ